MSARSAFNPWAWRKTDKRVQDVWLGGKKLTILLLIILLLQHDTQRILDELMSPTGLCNKPLRQGDLQGDLQLTLTEQIVISHREK